MKVLKNLFSEREKLLLSSLAAFLLGVLVCLQTKFPIKYESITKAATQCTDNKVILIKANLLGDVAEIVCEDGSVIAISYRR